MVAPDEGAAGAAEPVRDRGPELVVALCLLAVAALVIADSIRVGIGWADDGPRSGYFPFWIGLALAGSAASILVGALRRGRLESGVFAEREQVAQVASVFVPMVVYVAAIWPLGIYVASAALIAWFMVRHGRYRVAVIAAVAVGVPLFFFLVFERWFLVQLPKGPLERLLGF